MTYYAQTMPGVEEIAWIEIRDRLKGAHFQRYLFAKEQNGIVVFVHRAFNQKDELVAQCRRSALMIRKPQTA